MGADGPATTRRQGLAHAPAWFRPARAHPPQQVRTGRRSLAPQRIREEPAISQQQHPGLRASSSDSARPASPRVDAPIGGEHRVRAALGQRHQPGLRERRLLALAHPGRPKCWSFAGVSATSRHVPSIATIRRPANHAPGVSGPPTAATRANNPAAARTPTAPEPERSPTSTAIGTAHATPTPTPDHRSTAPAHPHTSPRNTGPSRSRNTPSPAPAAPDAAARCAPHSAITSSTNVRRKHPSQHPHRHQIRQPTIRLRLTPTRTRHTPNYTHVTLTERYWGLDPRLPSL